MTHIGGLISRRGIVLLVFLSLFLMLVEAWRSIVIVVVSEPAILLLLMVTLIIIVRIPISSTCLMLVMILIAPSRIIIVRSWVEWSP